jgi:biotin carboxylase
MKKLKVLLLGASEEMIPMIHLAQKEGIQVLATDRNPRSEGLKAADIPFLVDGADFHHSMAIAKDHEVDGILTRSELLLPVVARICSQLNLPGPSELVATLSVDKYLFRKKMAENGIATPRFFAPDQPGQIADALKVTGIPAIVKPVDYSGSTGVIKVHHLQEAILAWHEGVAISPSGRVIVEEILSGREVSVETWSNNGHTHIAAITDKTVSDNGHYVELRHKIPAEITNLELQQIETVVQQMAKAIGLNNCITHTEVMLTPDGAVIIETGARPGGDLIGLRLVELATGINMNQVMLYLALGKEIPSPTLQHHAAAIHYVTSTNFEFIEEIHNSIMSDKHLIEYKKLREDNPRRLISSADRLGYYLFQARDLSSLNQSLTIFNEQ